MLGAYHSDGDNAMQALSSVAVVIVASFLAAISALYVTSALARKRRPEVGTADEAHPAHDTTINFLIQNGEIRDVSSAAADLLEHVDFETSDWQRVRDLLAPRFHDVPSSLPEEVSLSLHPIETADRAEARIVGHAGTVRVSISEPESVNDADRHLLKLSEIRLRHSETAVALAPFPVWGTDAKGKIRWANAAFHALESEAAIHGADVLATGLPLPRDGAPVTARVDVTLSGNGEPRWFDVTIRRDNDTWLHYAVDVSAVIRAEIAQRNFVQTLTKTFALLSTGLAIFDRDRRLSLFNPAIVDLTSLGPDFLSARPSLSSFFEALREGRIMPEPNHFKGWREAMDDLDSRASEGDFAETWTLANGVTYRLSGRPYPNGAIAFVIEDISNEIGMSRRHHEFIKRAQSALDTFDEAVAIFSPGARLILCNEAYRTLWGLGPQDDLTAATAIEATQLWQQRTVPTPIWGEVRDYVSDFGPRAEWEGEVMMTDGRRLHCRFAPLADGSTLAGFQVTSHGTLRATVPRT